MSLSDTFSANNSDFGIEGLKLIVDENHFFNHLRVEHEVGKSVFYKDLSFLQSGFFIMRVSVDPIRPIDLIVENDFGDIFIDWVQLPFDSFVERFIDNLLIKYAFEQTRKILNRNVGIFLWNRKYFLLNRNQLSSTYVASIQVRKIIKRYQESF